MLDTFKHPGRPGAPSAGGRPAACRALPARALRARARLAWSSFHTFPFSFRRGHSQAVIDANIIPLLIKLMSDGNAKTRKEACWSISNATAGGSPDQVRWVCVCPGQRRSALLGSAKPAPVHHPPLFNARLMSPLPSHCAVPIIISYLVEMGCLPPMCRLMNSEDPRVIKVPRHTPAGVACVKQCLPLLPLPLTVLSTDVTFWPAPL